MAGVEGRIEGSQPEDLRNGWLLTRSNGSAANFHAHDPVARHDEEGHAPEKWIHEVWIHRVPRTAVIFGSTQRSDIRQLHDVDGGPVEVCRRRSGGGLVVVDPSESLWVDVVVPQWSPLHVDDVGRAFEWLGRLWYEIIDELCGERLRVPSDDRLRMEMAMPERGRTTTSRPFFCFDQVGHGEILVDGRKVVGISQRRTRNWTRLQSLIITRWDADRIDRLLAPIRETAGDGSLGEEPFEAKMINAGLNMEIEQDFLLRAAELFTAKLPHVDRLAD